MSSNKFSEIRKDYFLNKYVAITSSRAARPHDIFEIAKARPSTNCIFCPAALSKQKIVASVGGDRWRIAALKNKFPVFTLDNERAYGTQEVIIETPLHDVELGELPVKQIEELLRFYAARTAALSKIKNIDYILIFKNNGSKAGASLAHAHSQIMASEFLPPDVLHELTEAQNYQTAHGRCPYCETLTRESRGSRRIFTDANIAAFAPYASTHHYEAWIFTKRHLDNITRLKDKEFRSFAKALKLVLKKLHDRGLAYNYFLHQVASNSDQHFYLKIQPRDNVWGGIELGSGLVVNSVPPEEAAAYYRSHRP